jgi:DNA-binding transcriptional regulator YiaG
MTSELLTEKEKLERQYRTYLDLLGNRYGLFSETEQRRALGHLELFVTRTLRIKNGTLRKETHQQKLSRERKEKFEPSEALACRIKAGITQAELAKQLKSSARSICFYENGLTAPSEKSQNYLNWLKEQGYNPFEI